MLTLSSAFTILDRVAVSLQFEQEKICVRDGLARVLAAAQYSRLDLPPFNKSAMDGYAITAKDRDSKTSEYRLLEIVAAGEMVQRELLPGTVIKIMTGAPVPPGTAVVVPIEMTEEVNGKVKILTWPNTANICQQGEDVKSSDLILSAGSILTPVAIANLVACGITQVEVYRRPRIAIISTGNEIVDEITALSPGKIMDSNGPMLCALCQKHGLEIVANWHVADDYKLTVQTLQNALAKADIVLLSGGVSVGDFDFVAKAISEVGLTIHFDSVAIKPGKPITFASFGDSKKIKENKLVFGLPGNPVSAYITFYLFVLRGIIRSQTLTTTTVLPLSLSGSDPLLPLAQDFKRSKAGRVEYVPCRVSNDGLLLPIKFNGSAHLAALLQCDGFFVVPEEVLHIPARTKALFFAVN